MRERNALDLCPWSRQTYPHAWHGLPIYGCAGSHVTDEEPGDE